MPTVDLAIVALVVLAAVWGYRSGVMVGALALIGFGGGALLGSRVAPLLLEHGMRSPNAAILALPGALLFGGLLATAVEAIGSRIGKQRRWRRIRESSVLNDIGGVVFGACVGLVSVWLVGAALAQIDGLRGSLRDSTVLRRLNAALPPPGPLLRARPGLQDEPLGDSGSRSTGGPIKADPQVRAAARSVVKLTGLGCGHAATGSGWIAAGGIVVTNAHVVEGRKDEKVQARGAGLLLDTTLIWFDRSNDVALLRVPALRRAPSLRLAARTRAGTPAAILGFPGGGPFDVEPAVLGATRPYSPSLRMLTPGLGRGVGAPTTSLAGRARPGNSGGPIVDHSGRVQAMIFGGRAGGTTYAVPVPAIHAALRRARRSAASVSSGACDAHGS